MQKLLEPGETVLFRMKKSVMPIIFMAVFHPVWLYISYTLLAPGYRFLISGAGEAPPLEYFLSWLAVLLVIFPMLIIILLSYALNQLMITDRRVYIRKGLSGRTFIHVI